MFNGIQQQFQKYLSQRIVFLLSLSTKKNKTEQKWQ